MHRATTIRMGRNGEAALYVVIRLMFVVAATNVMTSLNARGEVETPTAPQPIAPTTAAVGDVSKGEGRIGPYCGINCLYAALRLEGRPTDYASLLKPQYIGARKGSSLDELKKAAVDHGMFAEIVGNLTVGMLERSAYPIILHTRASVSDKEFGHFILVYDVNDSQARVLDPPNKPVWKPLSELYRIWDGSGLVVAREPISLMPFTITASMSFVVLASLAGIGIWLARTVRRRFHVLAPSTTGWMSSATTQATGLVVVAVALGLGYNLAGRGGLLTKEGAASEIQRAYRTSFLPKLSLPELGRRQSAGAVIVDARYGVDYATNHIPSAINIPPGSSQEQRRMALAGVRNGADIILYCQSSGCPFAGRLAEQLIDDGYSNISLFRGGWIEWSKRSGAR